VRFLKRHGVPFEVADSALAERISGEGESCPEDLLGITLHSTFSNDLFCSFDVIVLSPGVPRELEPVQAALANDVDVIGDIELFADVVNAPVIAVTGSNGKSTVVSWVADVLVKADLPTVLNISDDHLDRYTSIDHYAAVKRSVLTQADNIVVNEDDPRTWPDAQNDGLHSGEAESTKSSISLSTSVTSTEMVDGNTRWHRHLDEAATWLCRNGEPLIDQSRLSVPGEHNALNALAVLALIESLDVDVESVVENLPAFSGLPHRTEALGEHQGVRWYNDSKGTNIDACIKAIEAMPGPVILIAGGIGKDADFTELGPVVQAYVSKAVLIGRDAELIATALDPFTTCVHVESLKAAVDLAKEQAKPGEVVLLSPACSSFDMFNSYEHRGEVFRSLVHEVLAA